MTSTAPSPTLARVLARLKGVRPSGDGFASECPGHDDRSASLSIGEGDDGRVLLKCFAGCTVEQIVRPAGLTMRDLFPPRERRNGRATGGGRGDPLSSRKRFEHSNGANIHGLRLAEYAAAKQLPIEELRRHGVSEVFRSDGQGGTLAELRLPYWGTDGIERKTDPIRFRQQLAKGNPDNRFRWRSSSKPTLYGLWRLERARQAGYALIVEGESDCHTAWHYDRPAVGIPGATNWKEAWASYLDGIEHIDVVIEPDKGGKAVLDWLAKSAIRDRVHLVRLGEHKDLSALHLADPERFRERLQAFRDAAEPWIDREREATAQAAQAAYGLAADLLHDAQLLDRVGRVVQARGYAGDLTPPKTIYVVITSRFLERPMNAAVISASAAGKNRTVDAALELVPEDAVYIEKAGSARALIYTDDDFAHRMVLFSEADSIPEDGPAASAVRSLATDNTMSYDVVERNPETNRYETRHIVKAGPTGLITTSTKRLGDQMSTRLLEIAVSDSEKQTREVLRAHAASVNPTMGQEVDLEPFRALQRYLALVGNHRVAVPFADVLAELVPATAVRIRRDFRQLLTAIQTVALLSQCQRHTTPEGWVEATLEDYDQARELLAPIFDVVAAEGATPAVRETVAAVKPGEEVTAAELARRLGISKATASYRIGRAVDGGWLVNREERKGYPARLVLGAPLPEATSALPTVEQVRGLFECSNPNREDRDTPPPPATCEMCGRALGPDETRACGTCRAEAAR